MANYRNQKTIKINMDPIIHKKGSEEYFLQPVDWKHIDKAAWALNGNAFKLWVQLLKWAGGNSSYNFSPANLGITLSMSENGARNALDELIRCGYVKQISERIYEFNPCADECTKN